MISHHAERVALAKASNTGLGVRSVTDNVAGAHELRVGIDPVDVAQDGFQCLEVAVDIGDEGEFHGVCGSDLMERLPSSLATLLLTMPPKSASPGKGSRMEIPSLTSTVAISNSH